MIEYKATVSNTEIPEIQGYKKQFSLNIPRGDNNKKEDDTIVRETEQVVEEPIVEEVITPTINEWYDIRAIIKKNEGFMDTAKSMFNEPSATVGYGFFDRLPDGTKITPGMRLSKAQADKQLDIALDKLSTRVRESLSKYNVKTSPEQFNILLDLGYHGGAGIVDKLLRESKGDTAKIGSLLLRYATTAKYGDTTITRGLKNRALRRSEGWNKYILKGKNGLKVPKFQKGGISPKVVYNALTGIARK